MMRAMRAVWIALLIALLPLRGWVGDAMALGLAPAMAVPAAVADAEEPPCHHAALPAHAGESAPALGLHVHDGAGCADCAACQICHTVALAIAVPALPAVERALPAPPRVPVRFVSAEPRRDTRPPIA